VYHSTLGLRVIKKKKNRAHDLEAGARTTISSPDIAPAREREGEREREREKETYRQTYIHTDRQRQRQTVRERDSSNTTTTEQRRGLFPLLASGGFVTGLGIQPRVG